MAEKGSSELAQHGVGSNLKTDLNRGVAALLQADKEHLRPHRCLNGRGGAEIMRQIAENPDGADTSFSISAYPIADGYSGLWLNLRLVVFLGKMSSSSILRLSPRQTSHIIAGLPPESKKAVLDRIKEWYLVTFLPEIQAAISKVTKQVQAGDLLLEDAHDNRVLDNPEKRAGSSCPYTEWQIAGEEMFDAVLSAAFGREEVAYPDMDEFLRAIDGRRR